MSLCTSRFPLLAFPKDDVSQKRKIGEHRDRELSEATMDEGKTGDLSRSSGDEQHNAFKSGDLNERLCYRKEILIIPGFRKNDVSQKRMTGEHRDRPGSAGTRAKVTAVCDFTV